MSTRVGSLSGVVTAAVSTILTRYGTVMTGPVGPGAPIEVMSEEVGLTSACGLAGSTGTGVAAVGGVRREVVGEVGNGR